MTEERKYTLELTYDEADALHRLLAAGMSRSWHDRLAASSHYANYLEHGDTIWHRLARLLHWKED